MVFFLCIRVRVVCNVWCQIRELSTQNKKKEIQKEKWVRIIQYDVQGAKFKKGFSSTITTTTTISSNKRRT